MSGPLGRRAWKDVRLAVLERDRRRCQIRGPSCEGWAVEVDHIVPVGDGGAIYDPANLRAACRPCNLGRIVDEPVGRQRLLPARFRYRTTQPPTETRL